MSSVLEGVEQKNRRYTNRSQNQTQTQTQNHGKHQKQHQAQNEQPTAQNANFVEVKEDQNVQELLNILDKEGKADERGMLTVSVVEYEKMKELTNDLITCSLQQQQQYQEMLKFNIEFRNHPIQVITKSACENIARHAVKMAEDVNAMGKGIVDKSKEVVADYKTKGAAALSKINAVLFTPVAKIAELIKGSNEIQIKRNDREIAKINEISKQYHKMGTAFKNIGRALIGKQTIDKDKEMGYLGKLCKIPAELDNKRAKMIIGCCDKIINKKEVLDKAASEKQQAAKKPTPTQLLGGMAEKAKAHNASMGAQTADRDAKSKSNQAL